MKVIRNNIKKYLIILFLSGSVQAIGFFLSFSRNPDSYNILDPLEYGIQVKLPLDMYVAVSLVISVLTVICLSDRMADNENDAKIITWCMPTFWITIIYFVIYGLTVLYAFVAIVLISIAMDRKFYY